MIRPKTYCAAFFARAPYRAVLATALTVVLCACSAMQANEPNVVSYEYRPPYGFVRIERIEPGAADNSHPYAISGDALQTILASLKVKGSISTGAVPIFTPAEVEEIVPHLVAALAKAGPGEDVTFAVTGKHGGLFGAYSPSAVITGRMFVREQRLNLVFGLMHERYEGGELGAGVPLFTPGSRARRIEGIWIIEPGRAVLAEKRFDWVIVDTAALPAPKEKAGDASAATSVAPATDRRVQEIESKLGVLEQLKAKGLITEEEYRERRRAIL